MRSNRTLYWIIGTILALVCLAFAWFYFPVPWIRNAMSAPAPVAPAAVSNEADAHTERFDALIDACLAAGGVPEGNAVSGEVTCILATAMAPLPTQTPMPAIQSTATLPAESATWKFDYPNAGLVSGDKWSIDGLPTTVDPANVLVSSGMFKNTIGLGSQSWLAEPGTKLVGPDYPADKFEAEGKSTEYISPINQKLIDHPGEDFHLNEDRIDLCSFGGAKLEFNGVQMVFDYIPGHDWFLAIRGLFPDGLQDSDRNHTILFEDVVGSHAQCMSYPGNGGGFISEGNFLQVAELSHKNHMNCGAEGCSGLTGVFVDLNTGAYTVINQANSGLSWTFESSNWFTP